MYTDFIHICMFGLINPRPSNDAFVFRLDCTQCLDCRRHYYYTYFARMAGKAWGAELDSFLYAVRSVPLKLSGGHSSVNPTSTQPPNLPTSPYSTQMTLVTKIPSMAFFKPITEVVVYHAADLQTKLNNFAVSKEYWFFKTFLKWKNSWIYFLWLTEHNLFINIHISKYKLYIYTYSSFKVREESRIYKVRKKHKFIWPHGWHKRDREKEMFKMLIYIKEFLNRA